LDYELYHDESQVGGYWHGILLVPAQGKSRLLGYLHAARAHTHFDGVLGIKHIRVRNEAYDCADAWLQIAVASLMSDNRCWAYPVFTGEAYDGRRGYSFFGDVVGAKFILFCERDSLQAMALVPDYGSKVEITFRMGFKGGTHFLGHFDATIHITALHFDGRQHLLRHVSRRRIIERIGALREYCSVSSRPDLIDDRSGNHQRTDSQAYDDCQLLQLTDLLVGSFRTALGYLTGRRLHRTLAEPVRSLVNRYVKGYARMRNSRWFNSFCMSRCYLAGGRWFFEPLECLPDPGIEQLRLPL